MIVSKRKRCTQPFIEVDDLSDLFTVVEVSKFYKKAPAGQTLLSMASNLTPNGRQDLKAYVETTPAFDSIYADLLMCEGTANEEGPMLFTSSQPDGSVHLVLSYQHMIATQTLCVLTDQVLATLIDKIHDKPKKARIRKYPRTNRYKTFVDITSLSDMFSLAGTKPTAAADTPKHLLYLDLPRGRKPAAARTALAYVKPTAALLEIVRELTIYGFEDSEVAVEHMLSLTLVARGKYVLSLCYQYIIGSHAICEVSTKDVDYLLNQVYGESA